MSEETPIYWRHGAYNTREVRAEGASLQIHWSSSREKNGYVAHLRMGHAATHIGDRIESEEVLSEGDAGLREAVEFAISKVKEEQARLARVLAALERVVPEVQETKQTAKKGTKGRGKGSR